MCFLLKLQPVHAQSVIFIVETHGSERLLEIKIHLYISPRPWGKDNNNKKIYVKWDDLKQKKNKCWYTQQQNFMLTLSLWNVASVLHCYKRGQNQVPVHNSDRLIYAS